jgi:uncharacterized protein
MRWTPGGVSDDIEDRRDDSGGGGGGFGFGGVPLGLGGFLIVGFLSLVFHRNLFTLFSGGTAAPVAQHQVNTAQDQREQPEVQFMSFVLDDVQNTWTRLLPEQARVQYRRSKLVLFRNSYPSACGQAQTAIGPFYCPGDAKVYLDLGFFNELKTRFGAPGEFAEAYVIAHEIGHHVQDLLGIERGIRRLQEQNPQAQNKLSVRLELQADCLAGVWGNTTQQRKIVDESDIDAGLRAAAAVGDDRLQRMATGSVNPDSFTHGSSRDRVGWFRKGLDSGQISTCEALTQFRRPQQDGQ